MTGDRTVTFSDWTQQCHKVMNMQAIHILAFDYLSCSQFYARGKRHNLLVVPALHLTRRPERCAGAARPRNRSSKQAHLTVSKRRLLKNL